MTNIAITSSCNRACDYCFAKAARSDEDAGTSFMSHATFARALDFVDRSGVTQIRLLGGEPTLHPEFVSFMKVALQRQKPICIFSNGIMPESALRFMEELPPDSISVVINLSASFDEATLHERVVATLQRLGARAVLGVNISRPRFRLCPPGIADGEDYMFTLIDQLSLDRQIRVGLAHPCANLENTHLRPNQYPAAGRAILEFAKRAVEKAVRLSLDCGFVPCMAPEMLGIAFGAMATQLCGNCGPVLDIMPNGKVVPCFPLATVASMTLDDGHDAPELRAHFERELSSYRHLGIFKTCADCDYRRRSACSGGCASAAMKRLVTPSFRLCV